MFWGLERRCWVDIIGVAKSMRSRIISLPEP